MFWLGRGPEDHKGAWGPPQWVPCPRDPNGIWDRNGARGSQWILGTTRGFGDHNGAWDHNETAMGNRNTGEPIATTRGPRITRRPGSHNEDHVPGILLGPGTTTLPWDHMRAQGLQYGPPLQEGHGTKRGPRDRTTTGPRDNKGAHGPQGAGDRSGAPEDNVAWGAQKAWGSQRSLEVTMGSLFQAGPGTTRRPGTTKKPRTTTSPGPQWGLRTTIGHGNHKGSQVPLEGPNYNGALGPKGGGPGSQGATWLQSGPGP